MDRRYVESWLVVVPAIAFALITASVVGEEIFVKAAVAGDSPWYVHATQASAALEAGAFTAAAQHWQEAYASAIESRRSDGLVELGDLYRRLGARAALTDVGVMRARQCYLIALLRARSEGSIDGVLRATEAFLEIKEDAMVAEGLRLARQVASQDPDPRARERIAMLAARAARSGGPR